jgi:hypothetical protein
MCRLSEHKQPVYGCNGEPPGLISIAAGTRKYYHHRWPARDFGHPRLLEHLWAVVNLMRASANWSEFQRLINRALPKYGDLPLIEYAEKQAEEKQRE